MKTSTVISTISFASVALAASSTPLIPSGISSSCSDFLTKLNSDATLASCTSSFLTALKAFAPGSTSSSSDVSSTLSTLCGTTSCTASAIRSQLTDFNAACSAELTGSSPNSLVKSDYDMLYVFTPFHDALCTKDTTTSQYCALSAPSADADASNLIKNYLSVPITSSTQTLVSRDTANLAPNATTFKSLGLPFLFLTPSLPSTQLCTPCTKAVLQAYVGWETLIPYALGLANSPILGGQVDLWNGVSSTCGADFMTVVTDNTGSTPIGGALSGAMSIKASVTTASMIGAAAVALSMMVL